jgi:hypothetical protein
MLGAAHHVKAFDCPAWCEIFGMKQTERMSLAGRPRVQNALPWTFFLLCRIHNHFQLCPTKQYSNVVNFNGQRLARKCMKYLHVLPLSQCYSSYTENEATSSRRVAAGAPCLLHFHYASVRLCAGEYCFNLCLIWSVENDDFLRNHVQTEHSR